MSLKNFPALPFRLGTTSYIIPADILPNVRYLAGKVDDIELVLFEADDYSNLPSAALIEELRRIAADHALSWTVHLPLDLKFTAGGERADVSIEKALKVIGCTGKLDPIAYIAHLDTHQIGMAEENELDEMERNCLSALERLTGALPDRSRLAIENLESYPAERNDGIVRRFGASYCVDLGHLWLQQRDPVPYLRPRLDRTKVIHLHGIAERDHSSLTSFSDNRVELIMKELVLNSYSGVVTLEIFSEDDFRSSMKLLREIL